ncbi:MAG: hypothetical protein LUE24_15205 [Lachnospiraceae bacterium]|nr:hypothetical protein [Lachnospiraceae bacterium]
MQIKNDYDKEVFNGDIGIVVRVDMEEGELTVDFDGREAVCDVTERNTKLAQRLVEKPDAQKVVPFHYTYEKVVSPLMVAESGGR